MVPLMFQYLKQEGEEIWTDMQLSYLHFYEIFWANMSLCVSLYMLNTQQFQPYGA